MKRVAVLGPGLLGGSICLGLSQMREMQVAIWARRADAVEEALKGGFASVASTEFGPVVEGAEIVILAMPVGSMGGVAKAVRPFLDSDTVVTDVGSVKAGVVSELGPIFDGKCLFVGSHPMAGSEKTGMAAARGDLFVGSTCIVTPVEGTAERAVRAITDFWQRLGARTLEMSPQQHDERVALISHFPHLLAACVVDMAASLNPAALELCGPGFRDSTRVASGSPAMWTEILRSNSVAVRKSAEAMIEKLRETITLLDPQCPEYQMHEFLTQAKTDRDRLRLPK